MHCMPADSQESDTGLAHNDRHTGMSRRPHTLCSSFQPPHMYENIIDDIWTVLCADRNAGLQLVHVLRTKALPLSGQPWALLPAMQPMKCIPMASAKQFGL